jgi:hypothetical protein
MRLAVTLCRVDLASERLKNHRKPIRASCQPLRCCFMKSHSGHVKSLAPDIRGVNFIVKNGSVAYLIRGAEVGPVYYALQISSCRGRRWG